MHEAQQTATVPPSPMRNTLTPPNRPDPNRQMARKPPYTQRDSHPHCDAAPPAKLRLHTPHRNTRPPHCRHAHRDTATPHRNTTPPPPPHRDTATPHRNTAPPAATPRPPPQHRVPGGPPHRNTAPTRHRNTAQITNHLGNLAASTPKKSDGHNARVTPKECQQMAHA
ncbi:hypothetical protein BC826DRAFT_970653 [Russula brevipes]|nr:hypothetical protein BC826DRAFT_970653 [Russula brevipes]